jgi:hypothetical protein
VLTRTKEWYEPNKTITKQELLRDKVSFPHDKFYWEEMEVLKGANTELSHALAHLTVRTRLLKLIARQSLYENLHVRLYQPQFAARMNSSQEVEITREDAITLQEEAERLRAELLSAIIERDELRQLVYSKSRPYKEWVQKILPTLESLPWALFLVFSLILASLPVRSRFLTCFDFKGWRLSEIFRFGSTPPTQGDGAIADTSIVRNDDILHSLLKSEYNVIEITASPSDTEPPQIEKLTKTTGDSDFPLMSSPRLEVAECSIIPPIPRVDTPELEGRVKRAWSCDSYLFQRTARDKARVELKELVIVNWDRMMKVHKKKEREKKKNKWWTEGRPKNKKEDWPKQGTDEPVQQEPEKGTSSEPTNVVMVQISEERHYDKRMPVYPLIDYMLVHPDKEGWTCIRDCDAREDVWVETEIVIYPDELQGDRSL